MSETELAVQAEATPIAPTTKASTSWENRGIELRTYDDVWRFSQALVRSGMQPKGMNAEACLIAIETGLEVGLRPMQAIQNIAVINGRPSMWGDALLAVAMASGVFNHAAFMECVEGEGDKAVASCRVQRIGGSVVVRTYSVDDAKKAGLWGKAGPWQTAPKRMLAMRARSFALRDTFPDFLKGIGIREVVEDEPAEHAVSIERRLEDARQIASRLHELPVPPETVEVVAEPATTSTPTIVCRKCLAKGQPADGPCGKCGDAEPWAGNEA